MVSRLNRTVSLFELNRTRTLWQGCDSRGGEEFPNLNYDTSLHKTHDVFVSVSLNILIVKDHQTVEPNAKHTCTAKRFHVTDILKPNRTEPELVSIKPNPNLDPDRNKLKLNFCYSVRCPSLSGLGCLPPPCARGEVREGAAPPTTGPGVLPPGKFRYFTQEIMHFRVYLHNISPQFPPNNA